MEIAEAAVKEQLEIMKEQSKKGEKFVNEKVSFELISCCLNFFAF